MEIRPEENAVPNKKKKIRGPLERVLGLCCVCSHSEVYCYLILNVKYSDCGLE